MNTLDRWLTLLHDVDLDLSLVGMTGSSNYLGNCLFPVNFSVTESPGYLQPVYD
jgi:hypothetical protein